MRGGETPFPQARATIPEMPRKNRDDSCPPSRILGVFHGESADLRVDCRFLDRRPGARAPAPRGHPQDDNPHLQGKESH